jgi:hypothetical protein
MKYQIKELTDEERVSVATQSRTREDSDIKDLISAVKSQNKEFRIDGLTATETHKVASKINNYCIRFLVPYVSASEITLNGVKVVIVRPTGKSKSELESIKNRRATKTDVATDEVNSE